MILILSHVLLLTYNIAPIGTPSNTSGVALNSTHIYIDWDPPPVDQHLGELREYRITVNELETLASFQLSSAPAVTEATIGPLHPYYTYNCTILAVTVGEGPPSTVITVRTGEDGRLITVDGTVEDSIFTHMSPLQFHRGLQPTSLPFH